MLHALGLWCCVLPAWERRLLSYCSKLHAKRQTHCRSNVSSTPVILGDMQGSSCSCRNHGQHALQPQPSFLHCVNRFLPFSPPPPPPPPPPLSIPRLPLRVVCLGALRPKPWGTPWSFTPSMAMAGGRHLLLQRSRCLRRRRVMSKHWLDWGRSPS